MIAGRNAYERGEFLTSTYERFRPVNLCTGPEGALYIVDMHHGLIQHKDYLSPYVIDQYKRRELGKFLRTGRIYRVVPDDAPARRGPNLAEASGAELVGYLSHDNGWVRDTAQRLLGERREESTIPLLRALAMEGESILGRLHALWTLEGMARRDADVLTAALADRSPKIRAAAVRLSEPFLAGDARVREALLRLRADDDPDVRLQFALSVSELQTPEATAALIDVLTAGADSQYVRDAVMSGLKGRELEFLEQLLDHSEWSAAAAGRSTLLGVLTRCVVAEANPQRVARLLEVIETQLSNASHAWRTMAMVESFAPLDPKKPVRKRVKLTTRPSLLDSVEASDAREVRDLMPRVVSVLDWPGKPQLPTTRRTPLTEIEQARFEAGRVVYAAVCGNCHKPDGMGQAGLAPPLVDSDWTLGPRDRLIKIVMHGLRGPISVNGHPWELDMPSLPTLSDDDIANVLTYVRREWEHDGDPVDAEMVAKVRAQYPDRVDAWTARELAGTNTNQ